MREMPSCILRNCFLIDFHDVVEFFSWRTCRVGGTFAYGNDINDSLVFRDVEFSAQGIGIAK